MSQNNQQSCSSNTDEIEEWKVLAAPEGFARVTRHGRSDIYLVQNHEGFCWDGRINIRSSYMRILGLCTQTRRAQLGLLFRLHGE